MAWQGAQTAWDADGDEEDCQHDFCGSDDAAREQVDENMIQAQG